MTEKRITIRRAATRALFVALVCLYPALPVRAQEGDGSQDSSSKPGAELSDSDGKDPQARESVSKHKNPNRMISAFGKTIPEGWSLNAAVQTLESYDDNVFLTNSLRRADTLTQFTTHIALTAATKHVLFEAHYIPEYNLYRTYDKLDYLSQSYSHSLSWQASQKTEWRWTVDAHDFPSRGNSPFASLNFGGLDTTAYSLQALENSVWIFDFRTNLEYKRQLGVHSRIYANANYGTTQFQQPAASIFPLFSAGRQYAGGVEMGWEKDLSATQSFGISMSGAYFRFLDPNYHQFYQTLKGHYDHKLPGHFVLSLGVGPAWWETRGRPGILNTGVNPSIAADVKLSREWQNTIFRIAASRSNQLGLVRDQVDSNSISAEFVRVLGRRWNLSTAAGYAKTRGSLGASSVNNYSGVAQVTYRITPRWYAFTNYGYTHQSSTPLSFSVRNYDRNQAAFGVSYDLGSILRH